MSYQLEDCC